MSVWPNPASSTSTLNVRLAHMTGATMLTLQDLAGKVVVRQVVPAAGGQLQVQDVPPGVYMLQAASATAHMAQRLIIK
jgi:uncharacterized surface anchored protein